MSAVFLGYWFLKWAPNAQASSWVQGGLPQDIFWIFTPYSPLPWVSESFTQDIGQISSWKVFLLLKIYLWWKMWLISVKTVWIHAWAGSTQSRQDNQSMREHCFRQSVHVHTLLARAKESSFFSHILNRSLKLTQQWGLSPECFFFFFEMDGKTLWSCSGHQRIYYTA